MSTSDSDTDCRLAPEIATRVWDQLSEQVDALIAAWESGGEPPQLGAFLADIEPAHRRMVLAELIKVDLENRWHNHRAPRQIEAYVAEFPELGAGGHIPCDLIYEEYHVRRQAGDEVEPQQYFERFPQQASELGRLLGLEGPAVSTILSGPQKMPKLEVGDRVDDFDLLTELGKGAFATVFLARQRSMQRIVALKISSAKGTEHLTMAQLDHPNIVRVYDQRLIPESRMRLLYMQHISGGTLQSALQHLTRVGSPSGKAYLEAVDSALVRQGESPPSGSPVRHKLQHASWPEVVCWLGARLAAALAYAHERGTLHRDIKPANVLVAADGSPKLADFNISFSSKLEGSTPAAYFGGSLAYMSPEQLEACDPAHAREPESLDGRSDVYSLGVMLWELLAGRRPFVDPASGDNWSQTLQQMVALRQAGVSSEARARLPAGCPHGLEQALLRCLSADLSRRFSSAAEAARHFELVLQPRAQRLLELPASRWRRLPRLLPLWALVVGGLLPNVVCSVANIYYNGGQIIQQLENQEQVKGVFHVHIVLVNSIAYGLAIYLVLTRFWPVIRAAKDLAAGKAVDATKIPQLRRRCLRLGEYAAWLSAIEWAVSGLLLSNGMQLGTGQTMSWDFYTHFIVSQLLWGAIAAVLTFFCVTYVAVHNFYPWLLPAQATEADEAEQLISLGKRLWIYFGVAGAVPLIAVTLAALLTISQDTARTHIVVLGISGLVASGLSFWFSLAIRGDLSALTTLIDPGGQSLGNSAETSDSFWIRG